ncbi:MAG: SGNH/GDSL hydrolase family protein [Proteobacteria bacterium]|nr:SGNH/GDSL hydrolase family protein [Pseudomonadota bacterium]
MVRLNKNLRDTGIVVAITLIFVILSEGFLRILFPHVGPKNSAYDFHPDYLVTLKPNVEKTFFGLLANGNTAVRWQTNAEGFRGAPLEENPDLKIMVYGDSNVQARFSSLKDTFSHRLETGLESRLGTNVDVINAGVIGFGPDQSLLKFRNEAEVYRPDIVIFHVFADNDFGDLLRNRLFELAPDGQLVETPHVRKLLEEEKARLVPDANAISLWSSLYLVQAARNFKKNLTWFLSRRDSDKENADKTDQILRRFAEKAAAEYAVYRDRKPRRFSVLADHYDLDVATDIESESARAKIALMDRVLRKARDFAASKNIKFLVLIQPSSRDLTENLSPNHSDLAKFSGYRRNNISSAVEKICEVAGIGRINLFDIFMKNDPQTLYFKQADAHWSDAGQALAAEATADYVHRELF